MRNGKRAVFFFSAIFVIACAGYGTIGGGGGDEDNSGPDEAADDGTGNGSGGPASCENDSQCQNGEVCEDHLCGPSDGGTTDPPDDGGNPSDGGTDDPPDDGGTEDPPDGGGPNCAKDKDCPEGQVCEDGACAPKCPGDHDGDGGSDDGDGGEDDDGEDDGGGSSDDVCAEGPTGCENGKTLVCHIPPGNPSNRHSICVGGPAASTHLSHGDSAGCCPQ